jgi:hypothetical protein
MSERKPRKSSSFPILTNQEMEALNRAAADGKHGLNYRNEEQVQKRYHQIPGQPHRVEFVSDGSELGIKTLEQLTEEQDADSALAMLYIVHQLAPLEARGTEPSQITIDFDDVIEKIGWTARNSVHRVELQRRIFRVLQFGERAVVVGNRSGGYVDKETRKKRDVRIEASLWRITRIERPSQGALFDEVPIRANVVISREWMALLTSPQMAQFLPFGEILGAIPGAKPSGAWARVVGLSLASFWRRLPRESMNGTIRPTRRELLERYPPKTGSVSDLLASTNPQFAINYWCGALKILLKAGIVAGVGEALIDFETARRALPRQEWADYWYNAEVDIRPGQLMAPIIQERVAALPAKPEKSRS